VRCPQRSEFHTKANSAEDSGHYSRFQASTFQRGVLALHPKSVINFDIRHSKFVIYG
jgi:hypothetical protein